MNGNHEQRSFQWVISFAVLLAAFQTGCQSKPGKTDKITVDAIDSTGIDKPLECCSSTLPSRPFMQARDSPQSGNGSAIETTPKDMSFIPGGSFVMGGDSLWGRPDEFPRHQVTVSSFYMDRHEVTNAQFQAFVEATNYVTTAERAPVWEELKKQLPPGTPRPADNVLVASSLVFSPPKQAVALTNAAVWWEWMTGADWRRVATWLLFSK